MRDNVIYIIAMCVIIVTWATVPREDVVLGCMSLSAILTMWFLGKDL